jgi:hypothetical protein
LLSLSELVDSLSELSDRLLSLPLELLWLEALPLDEAEWVALYE